MNEFVQFATDNWQLSGAWLVVAFVLLSIQIKLTALGPKSLTPQLLTHSVNRDDAVVIDIRGQADFNKGHIQGAVNVPLSKIKENTKDLEKYKQRPIIMVCANGIQVAAACQILKKAGFEQVNKLSGGMASWVGENLPVVK
ncbi:MAG: rhodanese-like domain-containing protein [Kangiellaceae bacterium]|nr:rhodanese-like domain-containing protein [Kangiellaceae bacterium]MCW8998834.1 rhodanese-like domain-containing protein [Kangiellaceae bacterium]